MTSQKLSAVAVALGVALLAAGPARAAEEYWHTVLKEVDAQAGGRDLKTWADELHGQLDKVDLKTLETAIAVFLRAGQQQRIAAAAARLRAHQPAQPDIFSMCDALINARLWDAARSVMDQFPDVCCQQVSVFVGHWEQSGDIDGLEAWLRARYEAPGVLWYNQQMTMWELWARHYFTFLQRHGRLAPLVEKLRAGIVAKPDDFTAVNQYVLAVSYTQPKEKRPDASWLGDAVRPVHPADAHDLGASLANLGHHKAAIKQYEHSLTLPVTEFDRESYGRRFSLRIEDLGEFERRMMRPHTRKKLIASCLAAGLADRAQAVAEDLVGPAGEPLRYGPDILLAGQVEAASGKRAIEGRILKDEAERKQDIRYWLARADYYAGRAEAECAVKAYRVAATLAHDDATAWLHDEAVLAFGRFLEGNGRAAEAIELYRAELKNDPAGSMAAQLSAKLRRLEARK